MSIASKIQTIIDCKDAIKTSINNKGGTITNNTPFNEYATAISNIYDDSLLRQQICEGATSFDIPQGTTAIANYIFYGWATLINVTIPDTVTTIGIYVFYGTPLRKCVIPNSVTTVGRNCFSVTNNLVDVTFGSGVTELGINMFQSKTRNLDFNISVLATEPPTLGTGFVPSNFTGKIFVPDDNVNDYKTATNWLTYESYIYPLSQYVEKT